MPNTSEVSKFSDRFASVPVPDRMKHLPVDKRGYPIPAIVMIDDNGKPHFTINEEEKRQEMIAKDCCPICGKGLLRGRWFVGGPRSAFDPKGVYIDTAMHEECMHYSMKVCPYLAAPNYAKRIDDKTLKPGDVSKTVILQDQTMIPDRPKVFVAVMAVAMDLTVHPIFGYVTYVKPRGHYRYIEFWQHGKRLPAEQGYMAALEAVGSVEFIQAKIDNKTQIRSGSE